MSAGAQIDLDALAASHGGRIASGADLDALAAQHGGRAAGGAPEAPKPSIAHDFAKYSPVGMVQSLADAIRDPKHAIAGILSAPQENAKLLDKAKESFSKGDYTGAAAHFLNYLVPGGAGMEDAGEDFAHGDVTHGLAKTAGIASTMVAGAKAPQIVEGAGSVADKAALLKKVATDPSVIREGLKIIPKGAQAVKFGDAVIEAAKPPQVASSTSLPETSGPTAPRPESNAPPAPGQYDAPAPRPPAPVNRRSLPEGVNPPAQQLSPEEIQARIAAAADAAEVEGSSELLNGIAQSQAGKPFKALSLQQQEAVRNLARLSQSRASATPALAASPQASPQAAPPAEAPPRTAPAPVSPPNTFVPGGPLRPPMAQAAPAPQVRPIPPNATARELGQFPAKQVVDWLKTRNGNPAVEPTPVAATPTPRPVLVPKPVPPSIAEQLRDEMLKNGTATPEQAIGAHQPPPAAAPPGDPLRDLMREVPNGMEKEIARSNYAGNQEPKAAGAVYEAAARADKANKLADALHKGGIPYVDAVTMDKGHWEMLSKALGVNAPSKSSIGETLFRLKRLEYAAHAQQ